MHHIGEDASADQLQVHGRYRWIRFLRDEWRFLWVKRVVATATTIRTR